MEIWLVRHGDAVSDRADPERPLSVEGRGEVTAVARALAQTGRIRPGAVVHSGKTRARQTAEILADALGAGGAIERGDDLAPDADPAVWAERVHERPGVMLVGHLPHMERLASRLVGAPDDGAVVRMVTGSVVCLVREAGQPAWSIAWMVMPDTAAFGEPSD